MKHLFPGSPHAQEKMKKDRESLLHDVRHALILQQPADTFHLSLYLGYGPDPYTNKSNDSIFKTSIVSKSVHITNILPRVSAPN